MVGDFTVCQGCPNAAHLTQALTACQEVSAIPVFHHTKHVSVVLKFIGEEQPLRLHVVPLCEPRRLLFNLQDILCPREFHWN